MNVHKKFSILSFVVFLSLLLSLVFPVAAMADDSTPPPPAAPAAGSSSAQTGSQDSSANEAAPTDAAPADAAPKDAAPTDAAATDAPSSSTNVAPTDAAATDARSSSTDVAPTDTGMTDTPSSPTDAAATDVPSGSTDVISTDSVATGVAVEPTADVVAAIYAAGAVLLDKNGNPVPLVSQQAANALVSSDPYFDDGAGHIVGYSSSGSCAPAVTAGHCITSATPLQDAITAAPIGATVFVEPGVYNESPNITKSLTLQSTGGRED